MLYFLLDDVASLDIRLSTSSLRVTFVIQNYTLKVPSNTARSSNSIHLHSYSVGKMVAAFVGRSLELDFFFLGGTMQE